MSDLALVSRWQLQWKFLVDKAGHSCLMIQFSSLL